MLAPLARDRWALLQVGVAVVACALFVALLPASGAVAGSAVLRATAVEGQQRTVLSYRADGAEMNHVVLFLDWSKDGAPLKREPPRPYRPPTAYVLDDRALEDPAKAATECRRPTQGW
jgi:hypothetical protein